MDVRNPEVLRWAVTLWVYAHWLPDITTRKGVDRLDDAPPSATRAQPQALPAQVKNQLRLGGKC